ncbi:DNA polymerase III subunit delta [Corallincola spongiicola]|uniref:DNA polymerase III subunit delta n=1 Tax=Corallincola spongiicola TaxID=2520508 RepID=A0ABY1WN36_9GAMM|nr:DNA polymerase III subunit delta [Corallincola spongiicola]TAA43713.1 DNA polymerase III subunit delta [Corallincola spongiicola]
MQCYPEQLQAKLAQGLQPIYMIFGDEPLQKHEAIAEIRKAAAKLGFDNGQRFVAGNGFDWQQLNAAGATMSLFSQGELIELELPTAAPGRDGGQWLQQYVSQPTPDQILIVHGPRLAKDKQKAKWCQALQSAALSITVNPLSGQQLQRWLEGRCQRHQAVLQPAAKLFLMEQCEGNLLAADQELQKLALLYGNTPVSLEQLQVSLGNHARHNVFQLSDALLANDLPRCLKILDSLQGEGLEPVIISWALSKEVLLLQKVAELPSGDSRGMMRLGIWQQRQPLFQQALKRLSAEQIRQMVNRCAELDQGLKGGTIQHPWTWLAHLCLMFSQPWQQEPLFISDAELAK